MAPLFALALLGALSTCALTQGDTPPSFWELTNSSNMTCVAMDARISVQIKFQTISGKDATLEMEVNNSAEVNTAQSYCNQRGCQRHINVSQLMLTWQNSNQNMYNLSFKFEKNTTITPHAPLTWGVDHLTLAFDTQDNPDFVDYANQTEYDTVTAIFDTGLFKGVPVNESYQCNSTSTYSLDSSTVGTLSVSVSICDWSTQAFWFETDNGTYANAHVCLRDLPPPSKVAPIVVGVVLGMLAVVVLLVYVVGRVWNWHKERKAKYEMVS